MNPKQHKEEEDRLVALIRALQSDINNPAALHESIARDEEKIRQLQSNIDSMRDRAKRLPELLRGAQERLAAHRSQRPAVANKLELLQKLRDQVAALQRELQND